MRISIYKTFIIAAMIGFCAGCSLSKKVENDIDRSTEEMKDLKVEAEVPTATIPDDVIRVKDDIWLGNSSEIEYEGEPVPAYLETADGITLISNRPITLYEIGDTINKITSLRVRYDHDLEQEAQSNAAGNAPSMDTVGADWTEPTKMLVSYQGPLSGLLDEISSRFGIWWKYEKKEIFFYKKITKTFVLYSLPTQSNLTTSVGGSSTEGGSAGSNSIQLSNSANIEMWNNIQNSLQSIVSGDTQIVADSSNGTISVTGTPNDIKKVAKFVNEQNARLSKQVAITVKVLQLTVDNEEGFGLDWNAVYKSAKKHIGDVTLNSLPIGLDKADSAAGINMTLLPDKWTIDATIKAISEQGKTHLVTSGTVTTMNNKPAPIQVVQTQNYISEVTTTSNGGDSDDRDTSVTTEKLETGFTLNILPRILEHGRLLVMFNMTLSDLLSLDTVYTDNDGAFVQNPRIESRGFSQEIAMKSGETLVLSGYERTESTLDKQGVGTPDNMALGGSKDAKQKRTMIIILLTPVVLETPLNPETRINL